MTDLTHVFGPKAEGIREAGKAARRSDRRFVRSAGQLAVYRPDRRPSGHVLTAWEAFNAFGIETLDEAAEYGAAILKHHETSAGQALKHRRESLRFDRSSVARAASVSEKVLSALESSESGVAMTDANRVAFVLGMDERLLALSPRDAIEDGLAVRLRTLQHNDPGHAVRVSPATALQFAEAVSIVRIQSRLRGWLGIASELNRFEPVADYGPPTRPAWKVGYELAGDARRDLELGQRPIPSMRALVEERLGIPVVQTPLPGNTDIAGATVATTGDDGGEVRGIVLNTQGANKNVWVRRATLAHELGHLLFDPPERLENLRVDSYEEGRTNPQEADATDFVEQRANAFAVAFLAPNDAVRESAPPPPTVEGIAKTMREFGIGRVAAGHHIYNAHYRRYELPSVDAVAEEPSDDWKARENLTTDYFPLSDTPDRRRGMFAYLVAKCRKEGLISDRTAALYLRCPVEELARQLDFLISLYELNAPPSHSGA